MDIRLILAVCITIISGIQYYSAWDRYETAIKYLTTVPKYRLKALEIAKQEKLFDENAKRPRDKTKEKEKEEKEQIIRQVIEEKMDIRGGYAKPDWRQILWIQLVILPYTLCRYFSW